MSVAKPKVLVAMSGGVDSSVAAALLQREGYDVVGCFMRLGSPGETLDQLQRADESGSEPCEGPGRDEPRIKIGHQGCCSINDAADARLVAAKLSIPFYVCNFKKDFARIIDYFVDEYNAGRTPNPCVRCNDWLKFGKLHSYAKQMGAQFVASGHYARIDRSDPARPKLLRGVDHSKDQSYVLFGASVDRLREMLLPIGALHKPHVRRIAQDLDLPVFDKPDSQEICFVPNGDYASLVRQHSPHAVGAGTIVDRDGAVLGEHPGHQHFTIGQRRGLGVAKGHPLYVVNKDPASNTITVGMKDELLANGCTALEANWLVEPKDDWITCTVKIRYNAEPVAGLVRQKLGTNPKSGSELEVRFDEPQCAVAPGQAVVCYDGEAVICGGWIREAHNRVTVKSIRR
ncbi:MAG: tRNA 2-thiouridine(34) synthase MnmA [Phycisphaerales bacterium]